MALKYIFHNNFETTIVGAISDVATAATLADIGPLTTPRTDERLLLTLFDDNTGDVEVVRVTAVSGSDVSLDRNQEGTVGPPGGWPSSSKIALRITAGILGNLAQGSTAKRFEKTDLSAWAASTWYQVGDVVDRGDSYVMICIRDGQTGGTEPVGIGDIVDNTCEWRAVNLNATFSKLVEQGATAQAGGQSATALGDEAQAMGSAPTAVGTGAVAGDSSTAVGTAAMAANRGTALGIGAMAPRFDGVALGAGARAGQACISVGPYAGGSNEPGDVGYRPGVDNITLIGELVFGGAEYTITMLGHEAIRPWSGSWSPTPSKKDTARQSVTEAVIYSIPVNLGDSPAWAASTVYTHGDVVFPTVPNGRCYLAKAVGFQSDYFETGTSDTGEPTWPTSAGSSVNDGGITWECIDPATMVMAMGDYSRFIPTAVGFVLNENAAPVTQPFISFGINGNLTKWLASTQATKLTGALAGQFFDPTNTEGDKNPAAGLVTAGTGNITGRFCWKGVVIETMVA